MPVKSILMFKMKINMRRFFSNWTFQQSSAYHWLQCTSPNQLIHNYWCFSFFQFQVWISFFVHQHLTTTTTGVKIKYPATSGCRKSQPVISHPSMYLLGEVFSRTLISGFASFQAHAFLWESGDFWYSYKKSVICKIKSFLKSIIKEFSTIYFKGRRI